MQKNSYNYILIGFFSLLCGLGVLAIGTQAQAAGNVLYISPAGNDTSGIGTAAQPWRTFGKAITQMSGGDTLRVLPGTYSERVVIPFSKSGTNATPTVIEGYGSGEVKVTAATDTGMVMHVQSANTIIRDLTVDGAAPTHDNSAPCLQARPVTNNALSNVTFDNVTAQNCEGHGLEFRGAYISGTGYYVSGVIKNSTVRRAALSLLKNVNVNSGWGSGIKLARFVRDVVVENNQAYDNWGEGLAVTRSENVTVRNNTVYNNFSVNYYIDNAINVDLINNFGYCYNVADSRSILRGGKTATAISIGEEYYGDAPLWGNQLSDVKVFNNILYNCNRGLAWFGTDSGNGGLDAAIIANNTFYLPSNTNSAIYLSGESGDDIGFYNNIVVETGSGSAAWADYLGAGGKYTFNNNYWAGNSPSQTELKGAADVYDSVANLKFQGPINYDANAFKLLTGSAAINKGQNAGAFGVSVDYFNGARNVGAYDIGAHEFGAASQATSSASSTATQTSSAAPLCKTDYNKDGVTNAADLALFAGSYKKATSDCNLNLVGAACYLDLADFSTFSKNYGRASTSCIIP